MHIQHGMELFNLHCASCHGFSENGIGPNLTGVTSEVEKSWLVDFIRNPIEMIQDGDKRAVKLFEKYKTYMPPFPSFEDQDVEDILAFVHKFSQGAKRSKNNRPGGILNPIAEKIPVSPLSLVLEEQFKVPASSEVAPITRINQMESIPGGRLLLHDIRGALYEVHEDQTLSVYLDVSEQLPNFIDNPGKGTGLASWAFHPDFQNNGLFYTTHSEPPNSEAADFAVPDSIEVTLQFVLLEWTTNDPAASIFEGTRRELLRADMVGGAHTFQDLAFNPLVEPGSPEYGMLYLGIGDGSAALRGYPFLCDNTSYIWSNVLRIDPTGRNSTNGNYGIPPDNPYVGVNNALPEIWASGFRNAHRITWDETGSGKMLITNIGQHSLEEVNIGIAGANYGWPYREGTFLFDPDANPELVYPLPDDDVGYTYPVIQYDHDEGSAVSGGYVYAGKAIPKLAGKYVFGDISLGTLFYAEIDEMIAGQQAQLYRLNLMMDGKATDMTEITDNNRIDLRMGTDRDGELYIMAKANGGVYKVIDCVEETI